MEGGLSSRPNFDNYNKTIGLGWKITPQVCGKIRFTAFQFGRQTQHQNV